MALTPSKSPGDLIKSADRNNDLTGLSTGENDTDNNSMALFREDVIDDHIASGLVISNLGGLNYSISSGVVYIDGVRLDIDAEGSTAASTSQDRFIYVGNDGEVTEQAVSNGTAPDDPDAGQICIGKIVTNGSAIVSVTQKGVDHDSNGNIMGNRNAIRPDKMQTIVLKLTISGDEVYADDWKPANFDTAIVNRGFKSVSSAGWQVKYTGVYRIGCRIGMMDNAAFVLAGITINSTTVADVSEFFYRMSVGSNPVAPPLGSSFFELNAGDVVRFSAYQASYGLKRKLGLSGASSQDKSIAIIEYMGR